MTVNRSYELKHEVHYGLAHLEKRHRYVAGTKAMSAPNRPAPGAPGIPARWTSSAKTAVGTALSNESHVWFTLSHGILNEIYYPRIDQACVRDMGLIITDGADYFSEEKRDADGAVHWPTDGVPAFHLVNTSRDGRCARSPMERIGRSLDVCLRHRLVP